MGIELPPGHIHLWRPITSTDGWEVKANAAIRFHSCEWADFPNSYALYKGTPSGLWLPDLGREHQRWISFAVNPFGHLIGYILLTLRNQEHPYLQEEMVEDWQRSSLGNALVHHSLAVARKNKLSQINLICREERRTFYEELGFVRLDSLM